MLLKKGIYTTQIKSIKDKIPDITNLATKTTLNAKMNEVKTEIPNITNLATNASLNTKKLKLKVKYLVLLTQLLLALLLLLTKKYLRLVIQVFIVNN